MNEHEILQFRHNSDGTWTPLKTVAIAGDNNHFEKGPTWGIVGGLEKVCLRSPRLSLGAVGLPLVAAYQWAGRLGIFGEATTLAPGQLARPRLERRTRHHPLAGLVSRLGSIHAPRP
jgi:hypothetical protein